MNLSGSSLRAALRGAALSALLAASPFVPVPALAGPLQQSFVVEDSDADDQRPDVAYDASLDVYAVVWQRQVGPDDHDLLGKLLDAHGVVLREFVVDAGPLDTIRPRIAGIDALDRFLVVYSSGEAPASQTFGRSLDLAGGSVAVGPPIALAYARNVDVGGDASSAPPFAWFVAAEVPTIGLEEVQGRFVHPDGTVDAPFHVAGNFDAPTRRPRVSDVAHPSPAHAKTWTVAYEFEQFGFPDGLGARAVYGDASSGPEVLVSTSPDARAPATSPLLYSDGAWAPYLVVWRSGDGLPAPMRGRVVVDGAAVTPILDLADDVLDFDVGCDGSTYVVSYAQQSGPGSQTRVFASSYESTGGGLVPTELTELGPATSATQRQVANTSTFGSQGAPQRFATVWNRQVGADGDLLGATHDTPGPGVPYCVGAPNSVGPGARIHAAGSVSISLADFQLHAVGCPPNTPGVFYLGLIQVQLPFGDGFRCIGDPTRRIVPVVATDAAGTASVAVDFGAPYADLIGPAPPSVQYQFWYRDPAGGPSAFNLTDALEVRHTP